MKDERFFDFMCSCGEKGQKRCEDTYEEVKSEITKDNSDLDFVNAVVYSLNWGLEHGQAMITGIPCDMWAGVEIEYLYDYKEYDLDNCEACNDEKREDEPDCEHGFTKQLFFIQCDEIHHGLARAYQLVKAFDETVGLEKA